MENVTEQPIKKFEFFRCPQSLPGVAPLTKKHEDSGYEIVHFPVFFSRELFLVAVHGWFALQTNVWSTIMEGGGGVHSQFMHILVQEFVSSRKYIVS